MAGYIFTLSDTESLTNCIENGIYSTKLSEPKNNKWLIHHEGVFADYATMKPGDNVYFFIQRKIYGIGKLVKLVSKDCKFSNYQDASIPKTFNKSAVGNLLFDFGIKSTSYRWICTFNPDPHFFKEGIDMDDLLASNPSAFRMLRALWKLSFIKFDDDENQAFRDALLKLNEKHLVGKNSSANRYIDISKTTHYQISQTLSATSNYELNIKPIISSCADANGKLGHEMALEAGLLYQLSSNDKATVKVFGSWDYLSHQVIASPFKAIEYMDKMDCFGYKYIKGQKPTKSKFLIAELKKDRVTKLDVEQLMKYVDWVKQEYCYNDYKMIEGYLVGYDFENEVIDYVKEVAKRQYNFGIRPTQNLVWNNIKLIKYIYNNSTNKLDFKLLPIK